MLDFLLILEIGESRQYLLETLQDTRVDFLLTCYRCLLSETQDVRTVIQLGLLWKFDHDALLLFQLLVVIEKVNIDHIVEELIGKVRT